MMTEKYDKGEYMLQEDFSLTKNDRRVIDAFVNQERADGKRLETDGVVLNGLWMGGRNIAVWKDGKIHLNDVGSRSAQTIQRAIMKLVPANKIEVTKMKFKNFYEAEAVDSTNSRYMSNDGTDRLLQIQDMLHDKKLLSFLEETDKNFSTSGLADKFVQIGELYDELIDEFLNVE